MQQTQAIPERIRLRDTYKRKPNLHDLYQAYLRIPSAAAGLIYNSRHALVDKQFVERLQLAVTEVNSCPACSYAHTYLALKQGMSTDEIYSFLSGDGRYIKAEESAAIFFAQHYAESNAFPGRTAYQTLEHTYGQPKARILLAAVQAMVAGNMYGIPYSALRSRLAGKPYRDSSLRYELGMNLAIHLFIPLAVLHGGLRQLLGRPAQRFDETR